jgi:hypothetical protein
MRSNKSLQSVAGRLSRALHAQGPRQPHCAAEFKRYVARGRVL